MAKHQRRDALRLAVTMHVHWIPMQLFTAHDMVNWLLSDDLHPQQAYTFRFSKRSVNRRTVSTLLNELSRIKDAPIQVMGQVSAPHRQEVRGRTTCYALRRP